jgi:predicted RNA methylase
MAEMEHTFPDSAVPSAAASAAASEARAHSDDATDESHLGQFIPLYYHHNMLMDENRMSSFKAAIDYAVFEGAKVLELGGGTGVLSCFAAAKASKVWCVEFNPDLVMESRRLLALNPNGHKVTVIHANAFDYLPPEPVDVVICEMIHAAMLKEKLIDVIEAFKQRYRLRFGEKLPIFIPEAVVMAIQPLQQNYDFFGFYAPIIQVQGAYFTHPETVELAAPAVYSMIDFSQTALREIEWEGSFTLQSDCVVNALRFITKNILAVVTDQTTTIDWFMGYLALPLSEPLQAKAGEVLKISFRYLAGGSIRSLEKSINATIVTICD